MNLLINSTGNEFALNEFHPEVWIAGVKRTDCYCSDLTYSNQTIGTATIVFPNASYDAVLCLENDLVTIVAYGNVLWRGYIVSRTSNINDELVYTANDLLSKFDDTFMWFNEFCYQDEVTKEWKFTYTVRQIAYLMYANYINWKKGNCDSDYLLSIDLESFPNIYPLDTKIIGMPLLQALQTILDSVDYRYKITVDHTNEASTIKCYALGYGNPKNLIRGVEVGNSYHDQPSGVATVLDITRSVSSQNTLTHIYAEGENRILESALILNQGWNLVADDYVPATGDTIKNYVTESEQTEVINNWEKYTKELIEIKTQDQEEGNGKNSNYRKKYENVCTRYRIPRISNYWYYQDDAVNYPTIYGETNKQAKIESNLVQTYDNQELSPFIVYKRVSEPTLYVKKDGFSIEDSQYVVFNEPFVDSYSNILAKGIKGSFKDASWNSSLKQSVYKTNYHVDLEERFETNYLESGLWLVLGEFMTAYKVVGMTGTELTVQGNLTGCGVAEGESFTNGKEWYLTDKNPFIRAAQTGVGYELGKYLVDPTGSETLSNKYAGMYLIIGDYDFGAMGGFVAEASTYKIYQIAYSSDKYVWINNAELDMTGFSPKHVIISPLTETKRPYEFVILNAAYQSSQKLQLFSGNLSNVLNKRIVYKQNNEYQWKTEFNNYRLVKSSLPNEEDKFTVVFNNQVINKRNDLLYLQNWATKQIDGANGYEINYDITLGIFDFSLEIGDRLIDNQIDSGTTITSIRFDFMSQTQNISATSWS